MTTTFLYVWPLWCGALVPSLAAKGLIVMAPSCVNSLHPSAEESWEEMTKIEPRNKMFRERKTT